MSDIPIPKEVVDRHGPEMCILSCSDLKKLGDAIRLVLALDESEEKVQKYNVAGKPIAGFYGVDLDLKARVQLEEALEVMATPVVVIELPSTEKPS